MVDRWTVRLIAGGLLLIAVIVVAQLLAHEPSTCHSRRADRHCLAALGGLSTFLVSTRSAQEPTPVRVDNAAADPVPVTDAPVLQAGT